MGVFESSFVVNAPLEAVWAFHNDPGGLAKITPPPLRVVVEGYDAPLRAGSRIRMSIGVGPARVRWNAILADHQPMAEFTDRQIPGEGPFRSWTHTHRFEPVPGGTRVTDRAEYAFPLGVLGRLADRVAGGLMIRLMFNARRSATRAWLERGPDAMAPARI
jgi:ligand-binding SRPBCC domain-containing protein